MLTLIRGQKIKLAALTPATSLKVSLTIHGPAGITFDISCFGLDSQDKLSDDRYFIFYNQKESPCGSLRILGAGNGDHEQFQLDLSRLPAFIRKLVFVVTIDGDEVMSQIDDGYLRILDPVIDVGRFAFSGADFGNERALIVGEVYFKDVWRFSAVGQGFDGGLNALLRAGRRCRAATNDQFDWQIRGHWRGPVPCDHAQNQLGPVCPALEERLAHRGQTKVLGDVNIIEADNREVRWHREAKVTGGLKDAQRLGVTCRKDRRRRFSQQQHFACQHAGLVAPVKAKALVRGAYGEARRLEHMPKTLVPLPTAGEVEGRRIRLRVADKADAAVAQFDQRARRQFARRDIVDTDPKQAAGACVHQNHGKLGGVQRRNLVATGRQRDHQHTVAAVGPGHIAQTRIAPLGALDIKDDEIIAVPRQSRLDAAQPFDHRRAGEEGRNRRHGAGLASDEGVGKPTRDVVQLGDHIEDTLSRGGAYQRAKVEYPRDGAQPNPSSASDITDGSRHWPLPLSA